ncbi:hypothetical protein IFR04_010158 [Cadophora malorum]|uniref:DUF7704 domain-containing protein n=1 Tax=Cadophora malorum TaxID=108018 RepID=A0A8H7W9T6_9HELO|nr:hypothetical protein IFR04_010158 [Cadophora malorum]
MAPPKSLTHISLLYRLYFLYFEPFGALSGTYLCIFNPQRFLSGTVPLPAYLALSTPSPSLSPSSPTTRTVPLNPLLTMALLNIASLYILFAITEGVVLRLTRQKSVWLAVIVGMACADVGHLYAAWWVAPSRMGDLVNWNGDEWINYGTLFGGLGLRVAFLMGVGRS